MQLLPDRSLELVRILSSMSLTISTAESCTGGLIGTMICTHPGVSKVYLGSICSYSKTSKEEVLGISPSKIAKEGVVSQAVASEMAEGARRLFKSDLALSTTGEAGPIVSGPSNQLGIVWCCISTRNKNHSFRLQLSGSRNTIRTQASLSLIDVTYKLLIKEKSFVKFKI